MENGADRFDSNVEPHHHFICRQCHCVIDLEMENIDYVKEAASKNFDGVIERYVTNFTGCVKIVQKYEKCLNSP